MPLNKTVAAQCQGQWITPLLRTPIERPGACLYGYGCLCCAAYQQRTELLQITGEPYICCGGLCPLGPLRNPKGKSWLAIETCLCPFLALSANRYIVQTRFDKGNSPCDDFLLAFTFILTCCVSVTRCFQEVPAEINDCTHCLIAVVGGCMHAQQQIEIEAIKQQGYFGPADVIYDVLPPMQQEMIQLGKPMGAGPEVKGAALGADGIIPDANGAKAKSDADGALPCKREEKYDVRKPLASLCKFW